uniref:Structural maintenance of chromosomes protein 5 n=1 Tax=Romanomermis culicivorax TaxID=13658 RepID=A0A915KWK8_ROMCU
MDSIDDSAVESLNIQKLDLESRLDNSQRELEALSAEIRNEEQNKERLRQQKAELENRKHRKAHLTQQINVKKANLANLQRTLVDIPTKKREINELIVGNLNCIRKLSIKISNLEEKTFNSWREYVILLSEISTLSRKQRQLNEERVVKLADKDNKKRMLDTVKQDLQVKRQEVLQLLRQANELLNCDLDLDEENLLSQRRLPDDVTEAFQLIPYTIQEIDELMEDLQARLTVTRGADNDAIERYNQLKLEYDAIETDRQKFMQNIEHLENELGEERKSWLNDLRSLINRINENFSKFFQLFACAGEVELDKGANEADYSQYGIKIRVKFRREDKELRELTHQRQSGGERSVSTMLYLLALQELSKMPFRCVDEINQGMDARNERKIFNLMIKLMKRSKKSGCRLFSAQYFMLTPKLLPSLHFSDHVTLLIVQNGKSNREEKFDVYDVSRRQSVIAENIGGSCDSDQEED